MLVPIAFILWFLGFNVVFFNIVSPILLGSNYGVWGTLVGMGFAICLPLLLVQAFVWIFENVWEIFHPDPRANMSDAEISERLKSYWPDKEEVVVPGQTIGEPVLAPVTPVVIHERPPETTDDSETLGGMLFRRAVKATKRTGSQLSGYTEGYKFSKSYIVLLVGVLLILPIVAILSIL